MHTSDWKKNPLEVLKMNKNTFINLKILLRAYILIIKKMTRSLNVVNN